MSVAFAEVGARTNFTLLDGASHPAEMVATAASLGHAGIGVCDTNSLAGVVRAHVAAKDVGIRFILGARVVLDDGTEYLTWPTDRDSYGRLTRFLSLGRMRAPKGECQLTRIGLLDHAEGWVMAAIPPTFPNPAFCARLKADARDLRARLAMPLLCSAAMIYDGADRHRLERLDSVATAARCGLLATTDPRFHHPDRRRLADVLTAIRLGASCRPHWLRGGSQRGTLPEECRGDGPAIRVLSGRHRQHDARSRRWLWLLARSASTRIPRRNS